MPRCNGSGGVTHQTRQKGHSRRGNGLGSYAKKKKRLQADRYTRPYLTGEYAKWKSFASEV